jgi:hypothetical protein
MFIVNTKFNNEPEVRIGYPESQEIEIGALRGKEDFLIQLLFFHRVVFHVVSIRNTRIPMQLIALNKIIRLL